MIAGLDDECRKTLLGNHGGNHLLLWYKTDRGKARAVSVFLRSGVENGGLLAIVLPFRELRDMEKGLIRERFPVERLLKEGRLLLFASEELLPEDPNDCKGIRDAIASLNAKAQKEGRNLSLVGRIAPMLFERGDTNGAMAIELAADSSLGKARLLCLYDASRSEDIPKGDAKRVDDVHTRSLYETSKGKSRTGMKRAESKTSRKSKSRKKR